MISKKIFICCLFWSVLGTVFSVLWRQVCFDWIAVYMIYMYSCFDTKINRLTRVSHSVCELKSNISHWRCNHRILCSHYCNVTSSHYPHGFSAQMAISAENPCKLWNEITIIYIYDLTHLFIMMDNIGFCLLAVTYKPLSLWHIPNEFMMPPSFHGCKITGVQLWWYHCFRCYCCCYTPTSMKLKGG